MKKILSALHKQRIAEAHITHGHNRKGRTTPTYASWHQMIQRCTNPHNRSFHDYGQRGISVCERWRTFSNFLADMGAKPPGFTIERIDNGGNYDPGNCKWAPRRAQNQNKRNNKFYTVNGVTKHQAEWARIAGISPGTFFARLKAGWPIERAVTTPLRRY